MRVKKIITAIALAALVAGSAAAKPKADTSYAFQTTEYDIRNTTTGNLLRGTLYMPERTGKIPIIITAHEFGGNSRRPWWVAYAQHWAKQGIAVYTFDFSGGGEESRSEGKTTEMSVLTEVSDLESVFNAAKQWAFTDTKKITIVGGSQGGAVSSIVAARRPSEIAALVLLYPAFVIPDDLHQKFPDTANLPEVYRYNGWINIGPRYVTDMYDFDFYKDMANYTKSVLIIHGEADSIVPISYSERAQKTYRDAALCVVKGPGHAFRETSQQEECLRYIDEYLKKMGIVK